MLSTCHRIRRRGFSLTELLVAIAIIGIISAIAVPVITRVNFSAREETANQAVTTINRAVTAYRQCGEEVTVTAVGANSVDEQDVMALLTQRDDGVVGTPFLKGTQWPSVQSDDTNTFRIQWNGRFFEVLPPGTEGTGLKINGI